MGKYKVRWHKFSFINVIINNNHLAMQFGLKQTINRQIIKLKTLIPIQQTDGFLMVFLEIFLHQTCILHSGNRKHGGLSIRVIQKLPKIRSIIDGKGERLSIVILSFITLLFINMFIYTQTTIQFQFGQAFWERKPVTSC